MTRLIADSWIDLRLSSIVMMAKSAEPPVEPPAEPPLEPPLEPPVEPSVDPPPPVEPPKPPKAEGSDWRDKRIAELTAKLKSREATPPPPPPAGEPDPARQQQELERLVDARATEKAAITEFNNRCNEVAKEGRAKFEDFGDRIGNLQRLHDPTDVTEASQYNQFLLAALETGKASQVLHELGGNLNEAARILKLSPVKMGIELERMAAKMEDSGMSSAPPPAKIPAGGGGPGTNHAVIAPTDTERADKLSTAEWMKRREADPNRWDNRPRR